MGIDRICTLGYWFEFLPPRFNTDLVTDHSLIDLVNFYMKNSIYDILKIFWE